MKKDFKFSVVMAVYNTEKYLCKSIDSVINQSLSFEDYIQLIIVDDKSTDTSRDIITSYFNKYPRNIKPIFLDENKGQANARNVGLEYANGKYINFLDSDDYFELNAFEKVLSFFDKHYLEVDVVSIPIQIFEREDTPHILNTKFTGNRVIDLVEEPNTSYMQASSGFFTRISLNNFRFPTNISLSEDALMINKLLLEKKKLGVVSDTKYYYRRRAEKNSTVDKSSQTKEYFIDRLEDYFINLIHYCLDKEGSVPCFIQYMLAYDLQWMLKLDELALDTDEEKEIFWQKLHYVLSFLDMKTIRDNEHITWDAFVPFYVYMKNNELHTEIEENNVLIKSKDYVIDNLEIHKLWIDIIKIENNTLYISGFLNSNFDYRNISFLATKIDAKTGKEEKFLGKYVKYTSRKDVYFLSKHWRFFHNFDMEIPITEREFSNVKVEVIYHKDADKENFSEENIIKPHVVIDFTRFSKLSNYSKYFVKDNHIVLFQTNMFKIYPYKYKSMLRREFNDLKKIIRSHKKGFLSAVFVRLLNLIRYPFRDKNQKIYIFSDRPNVGDDNASHLFRYASKVDDGITKYYALDKNANEFSELSKAGNMLKYGSLKHKLKYLQADKIISSHPYQSQINPFFTFEDDKQQFTSGLITSDIYFVMHGVTLGNISDWFSKFDKDVSLIVTVSPYEQKSFFVEGYGYKEDVVQVLGLPRFDALENNDKKQILVVPTWRKYLSGKKAMFINSSYRRHLEEFLNDDKFITAAEEKGYKIIFKGHPELNKIVDGDRYIDLLEFDKRVEISEDESYTKLLNESSLLITDYSSIFFDFAYMKKPLIYYRPEDDYHYEKSYFDSESMGFGDIITSKDELIEKILFYLDNNCANEEKYAERVDNFFTYHDKNNCERVYDWIKND